MQKNCKMKNGYVKIAVFLLKNNIFAAALQILI
ncbi:hypothetical protein FLACOL_01665 [Flavobacterium columnare]|uniref:Uncharacterized protein n=1 Tax=Flavobacterium columnare TaxID=996 RepID=A0A2N9PBD5_9FLAO|nr:hypothetical protein FLACOL_01665 [Flavobacterium columnare]